MTLYDASQHPCPKKIKENINNTLYPRVKPINYSKKIGNEYVGPTVSPMNWPNRIESRRVYHDLASLTKEEYDRYREIFLNFKHQQNLLDMNEAFGGPQNSENNDNYEYNENNENYENNETEGGRRHKSKILRKTHRKRKMNRKTRKH